MIFSRCFLHLYILLQNTSFLTLTSFRIPRFILLLQFLISAVRKKKTHKFGISPLAPACDARFFFGQLSTRVDEAN